MSSTTTKGKQLVIEASKAVCIDPKATIDKDRETMSIMFRSHDWKVEDGKAHGVRGVIIRFTCSRCGAVGHAICESP